MSLNEDVNVFFPAPYRDDREQWWESEEWSAVLPMTVDVPWPNGKGSDTVTLKPTWKGLEVEDAYGNFRGYVPKCSPKDIVSVFRETDTVGEDD